MTMLDVRDLTVALSGRPVLQSVSLEARAGQITAIVGPNGSGKTTLLRALTGDLRYGGSVRLNGAEVATSKPWQLAATRAVLAQATDVSFPFTVAEVVTLGLHAGTGAGHGNLPALALAEVGLTHHADRPFSDLSGGEQQRAHLARVLVQVWQPVGPSGARWLFLDEPVSSLDIGHQMRVMRIARRFADAGGAVVAVMHDLNLTAMFADRVALLSAGRLAGLGKPDAVLTDPLLQAAYDCPVRVNIVPRQGPWLVPQGFAD